MVGNKETFNELIRVTAQFFKKGDVLRADDYEWFCDSDGKLWISGGKPKESAVDLISNPYWEGEYDKIVTFVADAIRLDFDPLTLHGYTRYTKSNFAEEIEMHGEYGVFHKETNKLYAIANNLYKEVEHDERMPTVTFYVVYRYTWETYEGEYGKEYDTSYEFVGELDWKDLHNAVVKDSNSGTTN